MGTIEPDPSRTLSTSIRGHLKAPNELVLKLLQVGWLVGWLGKVFEQDDTIKLGLNELVDE